MQETLTTVEPVMDIEIQRETAAFEMLQRQAKMFAASSLVPKDFQANVPNCAIGINIAKRLGADPFMVLQNIDIIHGRPSFRATFLIAMVNAAGRFSPLQFKMDGVEGTAERSCIAWTKNKEDGAILEGPKITLAMAKSEGWSTKTGSKWLTMPELMLRYRAAAFFARLYAPDVTLGLQTAEEIQDTLPSRDVTPPAASSKLLREVEAETSVPTLNLWDECETLFSEAGVDFSSSTDYLLENGVLTETRTTLAECSDDELRAIKAGFKDIVSHLKSK